MDISIYIQAISTIILGFTFIILGFTFIAILLYACETYKLRKETNKQRLINEEQFDFNKKLLNPDLYAYFDCGKIHGQLFFVLENIGGSPAYKIKAKFEKPFNFPHDIFKKNITENPLFNKYLSDIPKNKKYSFDIGLSYQIYEKMKNENSNLDATVLIEYENYNKEIFSRRFDLSIEQFVKKATFDIPVIELEIKKISDYLKILLDYILKKNF